VNGRPSVMDAETLPPPISLRKGERENGVFRHDAIAPSFETLTRTRREKFQDLAGLPTRPFE
jgi:hypothetical protein